MLERSEIETFLTLVEELHFGRAARRLQVSPSAVSQTIRKLERRVGAPLFLRTSRAVQCTPIGERLAADLAPAWAQILESLQRAVDAGRGLSGNLRVGFVDAAGSQLLGSAARLFRVNAPDCHVILRQTPTLLVTEWLRSGASDLALTITQPSKGDLAQGPVLVREAVVIALPSTHPYARRALLTTADLDRTTLLRLEGMPEPIPQLPSREPGKADRADDATVATIDEALSLVGQGAGVLPVGAHASRYHPRPDIVYVPLAEPVFLEWRLAWLRGRETARLQAFAHAAAEVVGL